MDKMKNFEKAQRWLEAESKKGSELAKAYLGFLSAAPEPVKEHWLEFFWYDVLREREGEGSQDVKA